MKRIITNTTFVFLNAFNILTVAKKKKTHQQTLNMDLTFKQTKEEQEELFQ